MKAIKGGTVVTSTETMQADVLVDGDKVVAIASPDHHKWADGIETIDATGKLVMPGGVDVHTHMELPFGGTSASDTFETGTRAAAFGGTTTIVDFAVQVYGEDVMPGFEAWMEKAAGNCAIDYGFHQIIGDVTDSSLKEMEALMGEGVTSFKLFMAYPGVFYSDDGQIFRAMQKAAEIGATIMMHAENGMVIDVLRDQAAARGDTGPVFHGLTRPAITEGEAAWRAVRIAELAGSPLYIVHMAAKQAVDAVAWARNRGLNVFGETCPQYLYFSLEDQLDQEGFEGAKYVCSTPIRKRSEGHQDALWTALATNDLQVVSTDHCPFCFDDHPTLGTQKKLGLDDFRAIPNGMPTVENRYELLYHGAVGLGHLSLNRFVEVVATTPAKMFGLYPQKGTIAVGSDADIVILDPAKPHLISAETHHMNVDYSAWEGYTVSGSVEKVLSRGRLIVDGDAYLGAKGDGRYLRRATNQYLI